MELEVKKNLENIYNNFYTEHITNQYLYSPKEIMENPKKCDGFFHSSDYVKILSTENVFLLGVGGYFIFSYEYFYILENDGLLKVKSEKFPIKELEYLELKPYKGIFSIGEILIKGRKVGVHIIKDEHFIDILLQLNKVLKEERKEREEREEREQEERERLEKQRLESKRIEFENSKVSYISNVDKDNDGQVDLIDGESFNKLLNKHQKTISDIDKNYIQKFVKISLYLKNKKKNTQNIFESIKNTQNDSELNELVNLLKNQIHTYELLIFHSISMITSLVESDLITFYEIYESFDQLGVFNSNWENEVSNKLSDIGDGIKDLMYSINNMEYNIVNSLETLTYTTQDSFAELNNSITSQLSSIDSSVNFNNLLTGIQTYQMYKINQNTKRIN